MKQAGGFSGGANVEMTDPDLSDQGTQFPVTLERKKRCHLIQGYSRNDFNPELTITDRVTNDDVTIAQYKVLADLNGRQ